MIQTLLIGMLLSTGVRTSVATHFKTSNDDGSSSGAVTCPSCLTGLMAYYKLQADGTDSTGVYSETAHSGTLSYAVGQIGNAAFFGTGKITLTDIPLNTTAAFSVSAWMKVNACQGYQTVIARDTSHGFFIQGDCTLVWYNGSGSQTTLKISATVWQHVITTYDGQYMHIYVNGVADAAVPQPGVFAGSNVLSFLGTSGSTDNLTGGVDEVGVWSRVLTAGEIASLHNSGIGLTYPF